MSARVSVYICVCANSNQSCLTFCNLIDCRPPGFFLWDSPGKNNGAGCCFLLQGIFPTQGLNPCLLLWQADSLPLDLRACPTRLGEGDIWSQAGLFMEWSTSASEWWARPSVDFSILNSEILKQRGSQGWVQNLDVVEAPVEEEYRAQSWVARGQRERYQQKWKRSWHGPWGGKRWPKVPGVLQALNFSHHKLPVCGWVIFHCAYVPQLLYPFLSIHHWTSRLLPCPGCCKQCSNEHWDAYVFEKCDFSQDMCPVVGLLSHMVVLFLRNKSESVLIKKMNLDLVIQSDASQKVKTKYTILTNTYLESRKIVLLNLFTGKKWRHRQGEQSRGPCGGRRG